MNILITCAGRRGYLVEYFREVVAPLGGRVITANSTNYAAGLLAGDRRYVVPSIDDPTYIPRLLEIARNEEVGLVFSLFEIDLPLLAAARERFHKIGAEVAVSDPTSIEIANDKWRMFRFLTEHGIATPRTWLDPAEAEAAVARGEARFPLFVKPRWGMGSVGVFKAQDGAQLKTFFALVREQVSESYVDMMAPGRLSEAVMVQEFVIGQEYGADVLNDLNGEYITSAVKLKIAMRAGETDAAMTVEKPDITSLCKHLAHAIRHRGNLDVDVIQADNDAPKVIEINARFGGGYPFSHLAGARFPRAIVQMVLGETPEPGTIKSGVYGLKDIVPRTFDATVSPTNEVAATVPAQNKSL